MIVGDSLSLLGDRPALPRSLCPGASSVDRREQASYSPPPTRLAIGVMAAFSLPPRSSAHRPLARATAAWLPRQQACLAALCWGLASFSGCASLVTGGWQSDEPLPLSEPEPRSEVKTIPLETRWVRHPSDDPLLVEELWSAVDEQALPRDLRERLAANGLRAGLVPWPLPPELAERCAYVEEVRETAEQPAADDPLVPDVARQVLRLLPGRHSEVVATPATTEMVVLVRDQDRVCGTTYQHATAVFELTATAAADGKTAVSLVPVIKHGDRRREWIGEEGVFRLEAGQCREHLERLEIDLELADNAILVVTAAGPRSSTVGDAFFRGRNLPRTPQQTLIVRPLARSTDPVFLPSDNESAAR